MDLKILTGVVRPHTAKRRYGAAKISFDPHVVGGDAAGWRETTIGSGRYTRSPGIHFALRDFVAQDRSDTISDRGAKDRFRIDTPMVDRDRLEVKWGCEKGAEIREISYLIVGEV